MSSIANPCPVSPLLKQNKNNPLTPQPTPSYGTLLGATVFQTFINQNVLFGIISFPLPVELSKRLLPRYYLLQTLLPVVMALTYPSSRGIRALWDAGNRKTAMLPMAWMFVTALANWAVVSPVAIEFVEESGNFALMCEFSCSVGAWCLCGANLC